MSKIYAVIDLKSFYASVECASRGLDPFKTPLAVCDESRGDGALIMAVTPYLKKLGLKNIMRKFDVPKNLEIIYAKPNMEEYVKKSTEFNALLLNYFAEEDWYPYSIDETFLHLTPYLDLYKKTPEQLIEFLIEEIKHHFNLYVTVGIAPNMFLAKCALDIEAKTNPRSYARWTKRDVKEKLWKIKPLNKIWGIGGGYQRQLNKLGLFTMEDVAKYPQYLMEKHFGIMGLQLWEHAHGIDNTVLTEPYVPKNRSFTSGQVLHRDYSLKEAAVLMQEMTDELCLRLRTHNLKAGKVALTVLTAKPEGKTYSKSMSLLLPSNGNTELFHAFSEVLSRFNIKIKIRSLHLSLSNLTENTHEQLSLIAAYLGQNKKDAKLWTTIDDIRMRFGKDKIMRASALTEASTYLKRIKQIGGHNK